MGPWGRAQQRGECYSQKEDDGERDPYGTLRKDPEIYTRLRNREQRGECTEWSWEVGGTRSRPLRLSYTQWEGPGRYWGGEGPMENKCQDLCFDTINPGAQWPAGDRSDHSFIGPTHKNNPKQCWGKKSTVMKDKKTLATILSSRDNHNNYFSCISFWSVSWD